MDERDTEELELEAEEERWDGEFATEQDRYDWECEMHYVMGTDCPPLEE